MKNVVKIGFLLLLFLCGSRLSMAQITDSTSTPAELWLRLKKTLPDPGFTILKDEIVDSYTDPNIKLRRVEFTFCSMDYYGGRWMHPSVLFMPVDPGVYQNGDRRGKIVIVAHHDEETESFLYNYGDPIATLTGYPTLILPNPGIGREQDFHLMIEREINKQVTDPIDHNYFRSGVPYLMALDFMADILEIDREEIRAIIGGHSKRATGAYNAAAVDSKRIVGVVYMGNESLWHITNGYPNVRPGVINKWVKAKVLYLGATNEDGYCMYNINKIQQIMGGKWTIQYTPNYRHAARSEKHFLDWRMWIKHVFEGRPITMIDDLTYREVDKGFVWQGKTVEGGTLFRARIQSQNKIIQAKVWYVYNDDEPFWRDLVWYPEMMVPTGDGYYEGYVKGKLPDAWLVEVKDIAAGTPGYVSSLPQDITGLRTETKTSRGSRSRHWAPK